MLITVKLAGLNQNRTKSPTLIFVTGVFSTCVNLSSVMNQFKPGDAVRHKADKTEMVVISVDGEKVICEFRAGADYKQKEFPAAALEPIADAPKFSIDFEG